MANKKKSYWIILLIIILALVAYMGYLDGHEDVNEGEIPKTAIE
ncbi:hypothetical protein [Maribacter halichondriae]|nr:hypothetical protein [Maribacter sp. Hal144]